MTPMERFFIRKIDVRGSGRTVWMSPAKLPLIGFIFLLDGEVLVESCGQTYLCSPGHLLLIPENEPFVVPHFSEVVGYTGGFEASVLPEARKLPILKEPLQQAFWFDEGVFISELFNMLRLSYERNDKSFIERGLDLLVSRIRPSSGALIPEKVARFIDSLFDESRIPSSAPKYAEEAGVSLNYLNRLVKNSTGRPVGAWIDIARLNRAKNLLESTDLPIIEVATSVGLYDQSYFSRFFRKNTGETPSAFRKAMHGKS